MIGVGLTTAMIAGMVLGEQDKTAAEQLIKTSIKTAIVVGAGLSILLFVGSDFIAGVFASSKGAKMVELAARGLRIYAISIILYGINIVFVNYTQGIRRMGISNILCFLQSFVFMVVPALALAGLLQTDSVWLCFIFTEILTLLFVFILACVRKHGFANKFSDFLFLKEPFGVADEDLFEVSISQESEIIPAAEAVQRFCDGKKASDKSATLMSLFVEELSNNIIQFGFADGKKHSIDIRVMNMPDGWTLRFRDNCRLFDPTEWIKLHETDDPTANIGIRMVCGMAKKVDYLSTMELNNLTIRI